MRGKRDIKRRDQVSRFNSQLPGRSGPTENNSQAMVKPFAPNCKQTRDEFTRRVKMLLLLSLLQLLCFVHTERNPSGVLFFCSSILDFLFSSGALFLFPPDDFTYNNRDEVQVAFAVADFVMPDGMFKF